MSDLVQKLSSGEHPIEVSIRPQSTAIGLQERIHRGFVHIKFTDTQGGTELGMRLDKNACNLDADFDRGIGTIHLVGTLTLDYVKVRCFASVDLASLSGQGYLAPA